MRKRDRRSPWDGAFTVTRVASVATDPPRSRRFRVAETEQEATRRLAVRGRPFTEGAMLAVEVVIEQEPTHQAAPLFLADSGFADKRRGGADGLRKLPVAQIRELHERAATRLAEIAGAAQLRDTKGPAPSRPRPNRRTRA